MEKLLNILEKEKPDIVHSHLFGATKFAAPISKWSGVPYIIETAHIREAWRKGIRKAYFVDRFIYRFVDKVIAVSGAVEDYLINEKGLSPRKIEMIHNGVEIASGAARPRNDMATALPRNDEEGMSLRAKRSNPNNGKFKIGVIGRLEPQKGHKYFLEAVQMLGDKGKNASYVIAGDGALRNELETLSNDLSINDRVQFLGYRKDIKDIMAELDLIVLPSLYEGLPLVILEAGALGKPVIATNVDGSSEAIIDGDTGILVPSENSGALRDAIALLLSNKDECVRCGANARKHIETNFSLDKQVKNTEELYLGRGR